MKKKILVWTDSPTAATGYGTIAKYVVGALQNTGSYHIDQLGLNFFGAFYDTNEFPWRIVPANSKNPRDAFGKSMLLDAIRDGNYDLVWIQLDIQHLTQLVNKIKELKLFFCESKKIFPKISYYLPVDMTLSPVSKEALDLCDSIVPYTNYGLDEVLRINPEFEKKCQVIECGYDPKTIVPLSSSARKIFRKSYFDIPDENTFLIININRNSSRKMLTHAIKAFSLFNKKVPDSKLYLHTDPTDQFTKINLYAAIEELGLTLDKQVAFPKNFDLNSPAPRETLTAIYSAADCFLATAYAEGWGLTHTDAMAYGLPVVAPENSSFIEQLREGKGYIYPCKEEIWFHDAGYRPVGRLEDILKSLDEAYREISEVKKAGKSLLDIPRVNAAQEWMQKRTWEVTASKWTELIENLINAPSE